MKFYQKAIWSAALVLSFILYVQHRNMKDLNYMSDITAKTSSVSELQVENLLLKNQNIKLNSEIVDLKISHEREARQTITEYIKDRNRHVPTSVAITIAETILEVSKDKEIAPPLVLGIIEVESEFNPYALSKAGARGLMQVMPEWVGKIPTEIETKFQLHDIKTGINAGVDVFKIHLEESEGDISKALYYYVNKDNTYASKVYQAIGRYLAYTKK